MFCTVLSGCLCLRNSSLHQDPPSLEAGAAWGCVPVGSSPCVLLPPRKGGTDDQWFCGFDDGGCGGDGEDDDNDEDYEDYEEVGQW